MNAAKRARFGVIAAATIIVPAGVVLAGAHTWDVNEIFSNADGTIQFIELREPLGGAGEVNLGGLTVTSNTKSFTIPGALTPPSSFKHLLFATPGFAALPGAPTPDYIFPAGSVPFFATTGDTIRYNPYDTFTFGAGVLPTNGYHSLNRNMTTGCNTPTNYAGQTGSVNAACLTLGDVDGSGMLDGNDIAAFVRVKLGSPEVDDEPACAEYCTGTLAGDVAAFVADLTI